MFKKRIFLARNEKKYQHRTVKKAQSTLEYALILPLLILIILGLLEFAFIWQKTNSLEMATQEISANIATNSNKNNIKNIIEKKTAHLQNRNLSFYTKEQNQSITFVSNETIENTPILTLTITYSSIGQNLVTMPTVQTLLVHKLMFFPQNIILKSTKTITNNYF